ncbi:YsaB family lipoprotein [Buttiauxella gaviniae]|uniref:YsaB family lipoprotein n=1 Tax=Buttiauxella gaviniae TaxID=82990 RepID=A0ABV3NT84_9ENTR
MPKIKNCRWVLIFAALLLSACSAQETQTQYAQGAQPSAVKGEAMIETCKQEAAHRYNTRAQRISVVDFKQYQGSYEILGSTTRREGFTCSFDENGHFLHLSTV